MRTVNCLDARSCGNGGFDDVEMPHHRMEEDVGTGAVGDKVFGDLAIANVRGRAEGGFPVAKAPVPSCTSESWRSAYKLFDSRDVAVRCADGIADLRGVLAREAGVGCRAVGLSTECGRDEGGRGHDGNGFDEIAAGQLHFLPLTYGRFHYMSEIVLWGDRICKSGATAGYTSMW